MLSLLTGEIQTGKTRWLEQAIAYADVSGITVYGVLTPGIWEERNGAFEKKGINLLLLPQRRIIPFARPEYDAINELGWTIDGEALRIANSHLEDCRAKARAMVKNAPVASGEKPSEREHVNLLVVDEIGPLELVKNAGFSQAVEIIEEGPAAGFPNVIAIVRPSLIETAVERFSRGWGNNIRIIDPQANPTLFL